MTYFSSLNMIKALRNTGVLNTLMQGAASKGGDPTAYTPALKPGQLPGQESFEVPSWSVDDVGGWLDTLALGMYREDFADSAIDGAFLLDLTDDDLRNTLGIEHNLHRKKIMQSIKRLRKSAKAVG